MRPPEPRSCIGRASTTHLQPLLHKGSGKGGGCHMPWAGSPHPGPNLKFWDWQVGGTVSPFCCLPAHNTVSLGPKWGQGPW